MSLKHMITLSLIGLFGFTTNAQDSTNYRFTESISFAEGFGGMRSSVLIQAEID